MTKNNNQEGFTLIETLLAVVILAIISVTLYSLLNFTLKVIWESKAKITASQLANQKMEMARNLNYEDVGVVGGIPAGEIPAEEEIWRNNIKYTVKTQVLYIDDEFDGTQGGEPDDILNTDYKKVRVEVGWDYRMQHTPVVLLTTISPPGLESEIGGGTLKILVYDSEGLPVNQANVSIENNSVSPAIDIDSLTDNQGYLILPGAPEATETYAITISKNGYSSWNTYETTTELPSPEKPHASVYEHQTTNISFSIDELSDLTVLIEDTGGVSLSGVAINMRGEKKIGYDADDSPVYKYDQNLTSDAEGKIVLGDIEWDSYHFSLAESSPYNIAETIPIQPLNLEPATSTQMLIKLEPKDEHSMLIIVKDINDEPVNEASVNLENTSFSLNETLQTDEAGQVFFTPWQNATSSIEITKDGYETYTDEFEMEGYHVEEIILTQNP